MFSTVNPIATLVPPVDNPQQPQRQPIADAAHAIVAQFSEPESTQSRTACVYYMARELTCDEFDAAMAKALESAAAMDKASGWKPAPDAKGRDKYGPRQDTLASVASNMRQVFGAVKINPDLFFVTPDGGVVNADLFPNWSKAYQKAKDFLAEKKINWKGSPLAAEQAARKHKKQTAQDAGIYAEVAAEFPQAAGESIADYMARIGPEMEARQEKARVANIRERAKKEFERIMKVCGDDAGEVLEMMVGMWNAANAEDAPL